MKYLFSYYVSLKEQNFPGSHFTFFMKTRCLKNKKQDKCHRLRNMILEGRIVYALELKCFILFEEIANNI